MKTTKTTRKTKRPTEKKPFEVTIDLDAFEVNVWATNKAEAKKKAIAALRRKSITTLISKDWRTHRREIDVEER